jgi:predicted nuclease of predicted toxin-antitoxin system
VRLLVDECMPRLVVESLQGSGHDVVWTVGAAAGDIDETHLERSVSEDRVLISRDQDFADLVFVSRLPAVGIVLVSMGSGARKELIAERVMEVVVAFGERLRGRFTVIEPDRTRQRDLPTVAARR